MQHHKWKRYAEVFFFRKYFYGTIFYSLHEKITKHIKKLQKTAIMQSSPTTY